MPTPPSGISAVIHLLPGEPPPGGGTASMKLLPRTRPLFTPLSQEFMAGQPMTRAYLLMIEYGQAYRIDERGDLALLYFTASPLVGPHFLRRTAAGWTIDIWTEVLDTRNYAGGWYTWGLLDTDDEFAQRFSDRYWPTGGIVRIAGGDNRPLTVEAAAAERGSGKPGALVILYYGWGGDGGADRRVGSTSRRRGVDSVGLPTGGDSVEQPRVDAAAGESAYV